jgi:AcrR family transcriptional regulator
LIDKIFSFGTGRMPGDERRGQILQIAMKLFSLNGFRGTTTKEIANAAGVSEATVFKHFANKDELYAAILDQKAGDSDFGNPFAKIEKQIEERDDFGVFYGLALHALEHHEQDADFLRLMMHSALEGHELARLFYENFVTRIYEFLAGYIRQRQEDGVFRDVEPRIAVRAFIGMFVHHSLNNILWDKERKLLKISNEDAAREFANVLLQGIKNRA